MHSFIKITRKCYKKYFILCFILMYESNFVLDKLYYAGVRTIEKIANATIV